MSSIPRTSPYCSVSILLPFRQNIKYTDDDLMLYPHPQAFVIMYISMYDESFCNGRIRTAIWKPLHPVPVYIQCIFSMCHWPSMVLYNGIYQMTRWFIRWLHSRRSLSYYEIFSTLSMSISAIISDMTLTWTHINIYAFNDTCNAMGSWIFILGSTTLCCQNI